MDTIAIIEDESVRRREFPVAEEWAYFGNAGVCPLPRVAAEGAQAFFDRGSAGCQESEWTARKVREAREVSARLLGAEASEIALLGPTSLGLSLIAQGVDWRPGDEAVYHGDDYPANVYPWSSLTRYGVRPVALQPDWPGVITWELVEAALTKRTRLVSLATCHFLSGYRIDVDTIGRQLHDRGILFCLDGIQTIGAFSLSTDHVDFVCADSHKWMLGPCGAGIMYVSQPCQDQVRPSLLGSWNVISPQFIAQEEIKFWHSARRYEPGTLNLPGTLGMLASMEMLLDVGIDKIGARILELRRYLLDQMTSLGYRYYLADLEAAGDLSDENCSGIVTFDNGPHELKHVHKSLTDNKVFASLRQNRQGNPLLRFSIHFYNTAAEIDRAMEVLRSL